MKTFTLEVSALGYETTKIMVDADTKADALKHSRDAFKKFATHNDIPMSDAKGFGSLSIFKIIKHYA
jgi:hypothetical protein